MGQLASVACIYTLTFRVRLNPSAMGLRNFVISVPILNRGTQQPTPVFLPVEDDMVLYIQNPKDSKNK